MTDNTRMIGVGDRIDCTDRGVEFRGLRVTRVAHNAVYCEEMPSAILLDAVSKHQPKGATEARPGGPSSAALELFEAVKGAMERGLEVKLRAFSNDIQKLTALIDKRGPGQSQKQVDRHSEHLARLQTEITALKARVAQLERDA